LIFGTSFPLAGKWNQCFAVAQLNLPAASSLDAAGKFIWGMMALP
jgi:hypothetical protein